MPQCSRLLDSTGTSSPRRTMSRQKLASRRVRNAPQRNPEERGRRNSAASSAASASRSEGGKGSASAPASRWGSPAPRIEHQTAALGSATAVSAPMPLIPLWHLNAHHRALIVGTHPRAAPAYVTAVGRMSMAQLTSVHHVEPAVLSAKASPTRAAMAEHALLSLTPATCAVR